MSALATSHDDDVLAWIRKLEAAAPSGGESQWSIHETAVGIRVRTLVLIPGEFPVKIDTEVSA